MCLIRRMPFLRTPGGKRDDSRAEGAREAETPPLMGQRSAARPLHREEAGEVHALFQFPERHTHFAVVIDLHVCRASIGS